MPDKVTPGQDVTRGSIAINRVAGGTMGGEEIDPKFLRSDFPIGDGVNKTPKSPRTDPETYDYTIDRP